MEIKSLEHLSLAEIANTFNAAFIDYKVPFALTEESMASKIKSENIQLKYSAGAFDGEQLTGFILAAIDTIDGEKVVYNAGTGVLPAYRGRAIAHQLYQYLLQRLQQVGYYRHQLEVFDDNHKAIAVYAASGFRAKRNMVCYKGSASAPRTRATMVQQIGINADLFRSFWDIKPSWQNDLPAIQRNLAQHKVIGIEDEQGLQAYAIYAPGTGRIKQLAVKPDKRRMGLGRHLFDHIIADLETPEVVVTCVELTDAIDSFFHKMALQTFITMMEMERTQ